MMHSYNSVVVLLAYPWWLQLASLPGQWCLLWLSYWHVVASSQCPANMECIIKSSGCRCLFIFVTLYSVWELGKGEHWCFSKVKLNFHCAFSPHFMLLIHTIYLCVLWQVVFWFIFFCRRDCVFHPLSIKIAYMYLEGAKSEGWKHRKKLKILQFIIFKYISWLLSESNNFLSFESWFLNSVIDNALVWS